MDENSREAGADVTGLLRQWSAGSDEAFDRLVDIIYDDLRRIAQRHLQGERTGHTLDTCALVHECYLNLVGRPGSGWENRTQFYTVASKVMRRLLVDYARRRDAQKRGGDWVRITWDEDIRGEERDLTELLALDEALTSLAARDPRLAEVVECRFFGGMTTPETADALGVSRRTVERDWRRARAYLYRALGPEGRGSGDGSSGPGGKAGTDPSRNRSS